MKTRNLILCIVVLFASVASAQNEAEIITQYPTYHRLDGNRFIDGAGNFPAVETVDLPLVRPALWIVGGPVVDDGPPEPPIWLALHEDGGLQIAFIDTDNTPQISGTIASGLPPGQPPLLVTADRTFLDVEHHTDASPLTHAVQSPGGVLYVALNGDIVLVDGDGAEIARLPENAVPDARIVVNDDGLAAIYTGATEERYVHGIMSDEIEAASLTIIDPVRQQIVARIDLPGEDVFEGIAPMWADVNEDGTDDLITTASFPGGGAQLRVYTVEGTLLASSPAIGSSNRWRHQLAWGPFGADGQNLLVEVLTPHIGGVVGFFAYEDGALVEVGGGIGYSSHMIGSRNLDMAVAGDFDGDGQPEIVLPDQSMARVSGLVLVDDGKLREAWSLPLDGVLTSNLSAVTLADRGLALAAAVEDGDEAWLRVWLP